MAKQGEKEIEQTALLISEDEDDDLLDTDLGTHSNRRTTTTLTSTGASYSQRAAPVEQTDNKINKVQNQINDVIDGMKSNIGKVLDRGQRLDDLNERSDQLNASANLFQTRAKSTRKAMWLRTCRARMYLGGTIAVILCLLIFFIYRIFRT